MPFDELIKEVDRLAGAGFFDDEVLCQIGFSTFEPEHCAYFRTKPGLLAEFQNARFLIVHGGTGSVLQAQASGRPFVAIANPRAQHNHQVEFLSAMAEEAQLYWSTDVAELADLCRAALACAEDNSSDARSTAAGSTSGPLLADFLLRIARKE